MLFGRRSQTGFQRPRLVGMRGVSRPRGVVVLLHGGPVTGRGEASQWGLPYLRMLPIGWHTFVACRGRVAIVWVRFARKGWNGVEATPVQEATWVLDQVARKLPHLPIALIGHSMGARTALRAAGHEQVRTVVALAPWVPEGEPVEQLAGRDVLVVQGEADLITPEKDTAEYVERARAAGATMTYVKIPGVGHLMVRQARRRHRLTCDHVARSLGVLGRSSVGTR